MANIIADARNKRSQLISQRAAELIRADSPVSSTGSCHGTIVSDSTGNFFTDMDEDIANGDIWTSTGDLIPPPKEPRKNNNADKIRSTAKKHGRWEPRRQNEPVLNESAIAAAFPDFTSVGEAVHEQNKNNSNRESISIEIARGHRHAPNIASPRQSKPARLNSAQTSNTHSNSTPRNHLTADRLSNSRTAENLRSTSNTSSKFKFGGQQVNHEMKKTARSSLHKSMYASPYSSNATDAYNDELRTYKTYQTCIRDEMDNSFMTDDKPVSLTNMSNDDTALPKKNNRFSASRQQMSDENHLLSKEKMKTNTGEARTNMADENIFDTPSKKLRSRTVATKPVVESISGSGNPTQTTTSFVIPWHNNPRSVTSSNTAIPVFTAQGVVKTKRLPHEYVDSIDMPFEEEQIYGMIDKMKDNNPRFQKFMESIKQKSSHTTEEKSYISVRKRSDSGLGESGSEILGSNASLHCTDQINHKKNEKNERISINYKNNRASEDEIKRLSILNEDLENKLSNLQAKYKELTAENWARSIENKDLIAKIEQLLMEKRQLERNFAGCKEQIEKKDSSLKDSRAELANLRREKERDIAIYSKQIEEKDSIIKESRRESANLQRERERDAADWDTKAQYYENQVTDLNKEVSELHEKLARSEKSCKILKATSEKIMESTHELQFIKKKEPSIKSTAHKKKQKQKEKRPNTPSQTEKVDTQLTDTGVTSQDNIGHTLDFYFSDESSSDNVSSIHHTENDQFDVNYTNGLSSNLSDILGHGCVENLRNRAECLNHLVKQLKPVETTSNFDETINSSRFDNTTQSVRSTPAVTLNTRTSLPTVAGTNTTQNRTHRRSKSLTEKNITLTSKSSVRRHSTSSSRKCISAKDKSHTTNIFTDENESKKVKGKKSVTNDRSHYSRQFSHKHNARNCSICVRTELNNGNQNIKPTIRIERPVPVSDRINVNVPYEDELTIRPSISSGQALAKIMKIITDETNHLSKKLAEVHIEYVNHDPASGRKTQKALSTSLRTCIFEIDRKKDIIYALYDVLEGLKKAGLEMTSEHLDMTLTNLAITNDVSFNGFE